MKNFKWLAMASMIVLLVWGCSEQNELSIDETQKNSSETNKQKLPILEDVTFQGNHLVFKSVEHFVETISSLEAFASSFDQVSNQFEGFISSHEAYENLTYEEYEANGDEPYKDFLRIEDEGEMKSAMPVVTGSFSFFANKEGIIQFGDEVWKVKYDKFDKFNYNELSLYQIGDVEKMRTLETHSITTSDVSRNFWFDDCGQQYQNSRGRTRRVLGLIHAKNYSTGISELLVSTSHQLNRFGLWWNDKADLTQSGDAYMDVVLLGKPSVVGIHKPVNTTVINQSGWTTTLSICRSCTSSFSSASVNHDAVDGLGGTDCDCN
jgi:hypothetical protein